MGLRTRRNTKERRGSASKNRMYGGGSGISVGAEQYGVFGPGNPAGARADFEAMSRDAADSMIAYPSKIFPQDLVGQKGGAMNGDASGNSMSEIMKMMAGSSGSKTMGGRRRRAAARKTMKGKRKLGKALSDWNKSVMKVYREMKNKNKDVKLKDAMKETKRRKDRGEL